MSYSRSLSSAPARTGPGISFGRPLLRPELLPWLIGLLVMISSVLLALAQRNENRRRFREEIAVAGWQEPAS